MKRLCIQKYKDFPFMNGNVKKDIWLSKINDLKNDDNN